MLYFARRYDEAIDAVNKTLELNPNYIYAYGSLGDIYSAKGMHKEAIASYQKLIKELPDYSSVNIYFGAVYARAG